MALVSAVRDIRAFNIACSSIVNLTSAATSASFIWAAALLGDFFEGGTPAGFLLDMDGVYARLLQMGGCSLCLGSRLWQLSRKCIMRLVGRFRWVVRTRSRDASPTHITAIVRPPLASSVIPELKTPVDIDFVDGELGGGLRSLWIPNLAMCLQLA